MGVLRRGIMKKKKLLIYKILLLLSFPIAVVLKSIFELFLMPLYYVSGGNISVWDIDGSAAVVIIGLSFMAFCLVSIYQIIKEEKDEESDSK